MSEKTSKEKTITNLYTEFCKCDQKGDYERALKTINKIIHLTPDDIVAFQCKIVCLINLNRFQEALQQINKSTNFSHEVHFEKAYCLYRTNLPEAALKTIEEVEEPSHRLLELKAQVLYRLEKFNDAFRTYENILKTAPDDDVDDDYEEERQTNLCAVVSFLSENEMYDSLLKDETYEMCFNRATAYAKREMFAESEKMLKKAEKLLKDCNNDDDGGDGSTEEEIECEMANIRVLQAYCYQKQGRIKEAHQVYLDVLKLKLEDISLSAVVSNNIVVINKDQNVFDSKKKMKVATNENLIHKLPSEHRKYIALNNAIFNYYSNQHENSVRICTQIEGNDSWSDLKVQSNILKTLNHLKTKTKNDPIDTLLNYDTNSDEEKLYLRLTAVHLLLTDGNKTRACELLKELGIHRYKPGIVGALITLYLNLRKEDVALKIYEDAVEWYKSNEKSGMDLTRLYKQAAEFHIRNGHADVAAKSLEQLLARHPNDKKVLAQLVTAYSECNQSKAIEISQKLGNVRDIDVDFDNLENTAWLNTKKGVPPTRADVSPGASVSTPRKRKHRKRKGKLPKYYDASVRPDPERWLPKYERTGYRKKRDRRVKEIIKGSQGTAAGQSEQFDYSKFVTDPHDDTGDSVDPSPILKNKLKKNPKMKRKRR